MTNKRSPLSHDAQLVKMARSVARLEQKAAALRAQLKATTKALAHERRTLRGYAQFVADRDAQGTQTPPMRLFGERQGGESK